MCLSASYVKDDYLTVRPLKLFTSPISVIRMNLSHEMYMNTFFLTRYIRRPCYILTGAASGGALHLSFALGAPILPCNVLKIVLRGPLGLPFPKDPDDIGSYVKGAFKLAKRIVENNRGLRLVIHYDPVHDRPLLRYAYTIRLHLTDLPRSYAIFIERYLKTLEAVVLLNIKHSWPQLRLRDNVYLQVGGANSLSPQEFLEGSSRLQSWLESEGGKPFWKGDILQSYSIENMPESEWSVQQEYVDSVINFCERSSIRLVYVEVENYYETNKLGSYIFKELYEEADLEPRGLCVEVYTASASTTIPKMGLIPIWAVFMTKESLERTVHTLKEMNTGSLKEILFIPYPYGLREQGVKWPDAVSIDEWLKALASIARVKMPIEERYLRRTGLFLLKAINKVYENSWRMGAKMSLPKVKVPLLDEVIKSLRQAGFKVKELA